MLSHAIPGVTADEAVAGIDGAADPGRAAPPRHRPATAVPISAGDHVVAVAQGGDAGAQVIIRGDGAHVIIRVAADEAIAGIDGAADARAAIPPSHRPATIRKSAVPARAYDHVVAVAQGGDAAHPIPGVAADEAIGFGDNTAHPRAAVAPGHRPATILIAPIPAVTRHHVVA